MQSLVELVEAGAATFGAPHLVALIVANAAAFLAMGYDKWCAGRGARRVPEARLLLPVWFGGVLGMWLAMRAFRHKTQKRTFQVRMAVAAVGSLVLWGAGLGLLGALAT